MEKYILILLLFVIQSSQSINEECQQNSDCSVQEKTVCKNNICTCDDLSYYMESETKCVKKATSYESICLEDKQCEGYLGENSICKIERNVCTCSQGYQWYQGKCQKSAQKGEECTEETYCFDINGPLSLQCNLTTNTCECSSGYYDRGTDCRKISYVKEECAISMDCFPGNSSFGVPNIYSHCELGICVEDSKTDSPSIETTNNNYNTRELYQVDETCANGNLIDFTVDQCNSCPKTIYFENTQCICAAGYFLIDGKCVAELGVFDKTQNYSLDSDCPIKPGKHVNGICYCKDYWFQSSNNQECKKTTLEYTTSCLDNDWCKAMGPYALCNTDSNTCECISEATLNETAFYCELKNDNVSIECISDIDCPIYETCSKEKCECMDGFSRTNQSEYCLPQIGSSCELRDCNHIDHAVCSTNEICECESTIYVTNKSSCLKKAEKLYDECIIEEQCETVNFSTCLSNSTSSDSGKRCVCADEYLDIDANCYAIKYPGSLCGTQKDCTIMLGETFVCRNMICQCAIGQTLNDQNVCVASSGGSGFVPSLWTMIVVLIILMMMSTK